MEEPQKHNLHLPSTDPMYILPIPTTQSIPEAPAAKAEASLLAPLVQNFRKLVAIVQNFSITSKTLAAAHVAWHNKWSYQNRLGSDLEHLNLSNSTSSTSSGNLQRLEKLVKGNQSPSVFV